MAQKEHRAIIAACRERDAEKAAELTCLQLPPVSKSAGNHHLPSKRRPKNRAIISPTYHGRVLTVRAPNQSSPEQHRNPYKGLRAFQENDAPDFFGREALVARMAERLSEDDPTARFLAVIGPSGSGKSSAVKARLIPDLRRAHEKTYSPARIRWKNWPVPHSAGKLCWRLDSKVPATSAINGAPHSPTTA